MTIREKLAGLFERAKALENELRLVNGQIEEILRPVATKAIKEMDDGDRGPRSKKGSATDKMLTHLRLNREKSFSIDELVMAGGFKNAMTARSTVQRLKKAGRIDQPERGRFKAGSKLEAT